MARGQHADQSRKKEGKASQSEFQRRVRDLVNLPRHGNRLRFSAENHHQARALVQPEVTRAERVRRSQRRSTIAFSHIYMLSHFMAKLWREKKGRLDLCDQCIPSQMELPR